MYCNIMAPPDRCVAGQSSVMLSKGCDVLNAVHILQSKFSSGVWKMMNCIHCYNTTCKVPKEWGNQESESSDTC